MFYDISCGLKLLGDLFGNKIYVLFIIFIVTLELFEVLVTIVLIFNK